MTVAPIQSKQYIELQNEKYTIIGTRISLDSILYGFLNGESPETIAQNFPQVSLEQVYGAICLQQRFAIAFYLANRKPIDSYLKQGEAEFEKLQQSCRENNPSLYQKLHLILVTHNTREFSRVNRLQIEDWEEKEL